MAALLICAAEPICGFFGKQKQTELYNPIRLAEQLAAAKIVVVQKDSSGWDQARYFEDGLHFVEQQRLQDCKLPFVIIDTGIGKQAEQGERRRVYEDPYVRCISMADIQRAPSLERLLEHFDLSLSEEEKQMLFEDLRQTTYRHEGYINALRHRAMRVMDRSRQPSETQPSWQDELHGLMQQAYQLLKAWCPQCDLSPRHRLLLDALAKGTHASITHQALVEWFEEIAGLVEQSKNKKAEQVSPLPDIQVLYVSDMAENRSRLEERFDETYDYYHIKCRSVATHEEAIAAVASCEEQFCTVVADFRFYDAEAQRVAPRNGYHILSKLQKNYPHWQYLMLTNFPVNEFDTLPIPRQVEVFAKSEVLDPQSPAFSHFARHIVAFHERAAAQQDDWPVVLQSKDDEKWREYYRRFVKGVDFDAAESELGQQARQAIQALINGEPYEIPGHGVRFSGWVKREHAKDSGNIEQEEIILSKLRDMLLVRRIYLGLFQLNLVRLFPEYRALARTSRFSNDCKKVMTQAYCLVNADKVEAEALPHDKALSDYFTNLRLLTKVDYRISNECRASHLTLAETNWLARQHDFLQQLNRLR
jgi:hypothetical protein